MFGWDNVDDLTFMQDGTSPHFAHNVHAWLDQHLSAQWMGRRGPHEWPPRSPDLTSRDVDLWGFTKADVFKTKSRTLKYLEMQLLKVFNDIPDDIL